jgi:hypothetical protein
MDTLCTVTSGIQTDGQIEDETYIFRRPKHHHSEIFQSLRISFAVARIHIIVHSTDKKETGFPHPLPFEFLAPCKDAPRPVCPRPVVSVDAELEDVDEASNVCFA